MSKITTLTLSAIGALAMTSLAPAMAQDQAAAAAPAASDSPGDDIVVTALRAPVPLQQVAVSLTVIDEAALHFAQPLALTDILDRTPGISVARNGGYGATTSLRIRGADPAQTIVVVDGMRMSDQTAIAGGFDFSQLFADDVSRIEILRGPQSILWGSDAIGGIVAVTTAKPTRPLGADIAFEGGSHDTVSARAGIGGTSTLVDWRLSGSTFSTSGIPSLTGGTLPNGYSRQSGSATATVHIASNVSLDLRGYWDEARTSYSDNYNLESGIYAGDIQQNNQWSGYAGLNVALLDGHWQNRFAFLQNETNIEDVTPIDSPALTFVGHGRTRRYEYQGSLAASRWLDLVFGAEREEQRMMTGSPWDSVQPYDLTLHAVSTDSLYGQARLTPVKGLSLSGGVRYDHQSQFGGNTVFSAGGTYTPDDGTTLVRVSYDEGFKAPSLYQLYSDYGSTALQPEHAKGWQAGIERSFLARLLTLSGSWFERRSTNLIEYLSCPYSGTIPAVCYIPGTSIQRYGYYANVAKAESHGFELAGHGRIGPVFAQANYSIIVSEDRTADSSTYGQQLPRVPRHLANAELGYAWSAGLTTSVAARWAGASLNTAGSSVWLNGYALVDLRTEWKIPEGFAKGLTVFGRIENLGDRHYQTAAGYNSLGRTAALGIRGSF